MGQQQGKAPGRDGSAIASKPQRASFSARTLSDSDRPVVSVSDGVSAGHGRQPSQSMGALATKAKEQEKAQAQSSSSGSSGAGWTVLRRNGKALYDFDPKGQAFAVPLTEGAIVEVYEQAGGWYRGTVMTSPPRNGIFPASFVQLGDGIIAQAADRGAKDASDLLQKLAAIRERKRLLEAKRAQVLSPDYKGASSQTEASGPSSNELAAPVMRSARRASFTEVIERSNPLSPASSDVIREASLASLEMEDIMETFNILEEVEADSGKRLGYVQAKELLELLPTLHDRATPADIAKFMQAVDPENKGQVTKAAYVSAMQASGWLQYRYASRAMSGAYETRHSSLTAMMTKLELEHATPDSLDILAVMDPENKGYVLTLELLEVVDDMIGERVLSDHQLERLLSEADPDNSGRIERLPFLKLLKMLLEPPPAAPPPGAHHIPRFMRRKTLSAKDITAAPLNSSASAPLYRGSGVARSESSLQAVAEQKSTPDADETAADPASHDAPDSTATAAEPAAPPLPDEPPELPPELPQPSEELPPALPPDLPALPP